MGRVESTNGVPALVPELLVSDLSASLDFWCGLCGFSIAYDRPDEGFAYLARGTAEVMLEERGVGRNWLAAELEAPYGRGINLQIAVDDLSPLLKALSEAPWPLFLDAEERWYRSGAEQVGVQQFLVADPDGYLLRFQRSLGRRSLDGPLAG